MENLEERKVVALDAIADNLEKIDTTLRETLGSVEAGNALEAIQKIGDILDGRLGI